MTQPAPQLPAVQDPSRNELRHLHSHYQSSHAPFSKYGWAANMYDSTSQKELHR